MIIYLPSNAQAAGFKHNTTSKFTIPLPHPLSFPINEKWHVSIIEIQIPITVFNLEDDDIENKISITDSKNTIYHTYVNPGCYTNNKDLVWGINNKIVNVLKETDIVDIITLDTDGMRAIINTEEQGKSESQKKGITITFSDRLASVLRLPKIILPNQVIISSNHVDVWRDKSTIFIFSDILRERIFNDTMKPLLDHVLISNNNFGDQLLVQNYPPIYYPVAKDNYSTISIWITDQNFNPIKFRSGSVLLKLKFDKYDDIE